MVRPKQQDPTPAELEVLQVLWEHGPGTVRMVMEHLHDTRPRGYTTVMSLLNVMHQKGLLARESSGLAYVYSAKVDQAKTLKRMVGDLLRRAFGGSSTAMLTHLLDHASPGDEELRAIRDVIEEHSRDRGEQP